MWVGLQPDAPSELPGDTPDADPPAAPAPVAIIMARFPTLARRHTMHILITGGAGFLGRKLATALLARGSLAGADGAPRRIERITLVDLAPAADFAGERVRSIAGDLGDATLLDRAFVRGVDGVFHLAAVVSGEAEANFDLGWRVNVDATRALLERCRALSTPPRVAFASSVAVFGGALPDRVPDSQALTPQSSYGAQKAVGELLVHDYARKGFIDGRSLRLPTVTVRPGKPNKAASSFASGIIREPLSGVEANCPVDPSTRMWLVSPRTIVDSLIVGYEAPASAFPPSHSVNVPGISVTVREMVDALRRVASAAVANLVTFRHDPVIDRIVRTWPRDFDAQVGRALGMHADADFESIVRQYVEHDLPR
ncbi:D-erythronate dehydrogenase [Burkholderiales bacterium]|nr:D-erythronate dehydrogenase [Burkholderiales bacterium]